jgi:UDP-2,4-diacetamido-2,4,6-trideoxy-beta-L-altropyranose hydrolase
MKVAFRANGGSAGIGLGHLMRCIAVADAFKRTGAVSWFVSKDYPAGVRLIQERGYEVRTIPNQAQPDEDLKKTVELANDADIIVADSYEFTGDYLAGLKATGKFVAAFDDKIDRDLPVDAVIGNVYATRDLYGNKLPKETALIAGAKFIPLRNDFQGLQKYAVKDAVRRVLVTMGGEDPVNVTQLVVDALQNYPSQLTLDILIGSAYKNRESLEQSLKGSKHVSVIRENVRSVIPLYQSVDAAITAPGITFWELAAAGVPMAVIQTADNQEGVVGYAAKNHLGLVLGWHNQLSNDDIISGLKMLESKKMRVQYSENCQKLVDGKGAERIAEALSQEYSKRAK